MILKSVKLGELLELLTDYHANGAYKKLKENVELLDEPDYAIMIRTTNFEQNNFNSSLKYITEDAYHFLRKSKVYPNDILMNKIANAGSAYLMPDLKTPVSLAMNLFLLRVKTDLVNPVYLYIYLKINERYVKSFANGSATKTITKDSVRNLEIKLPTRKIQDYIANIYLDFTKKIELNEQMNETLEAIAQSLFKSWFVDFDPVIDNALATGNTIPDVFKERAEKRKDNQQFKSQKDQAICALFPDEFEHNEEVGWSPKGWNEVQIKDIAVIIKGKGYRSSELSKSQTALVTLKSFKRGGGYRLDGLKEYTGKYRKEQEVKAGDLVIAYTDVTQAADVIGRPAMVINDARYKHLVISLDVAVIKPEVDAQKYYLYGIAKTEAFQVHTHSHITGTTVLHLAKNAVPDYPLCLPNEIVLNSYTDIVKPLFTSVNNNIGEIKNLEKLRDTLLPKLMSGELRIPDAAALVDEAI